MNEPFEATGLGMPWFSVFGNHDALVQGNLEASPRLTELAIGCRKVTDLPDPTLASIREQRGPDARSSTRPIPR